MKTSLFLILWLLAASGAFAQSAAQPATDEPDPRLARLEAAYNRVQMEQQSVFQQFQMAQELRRNELLEGQTNVIQRYSATGMDGARPLDYDENVRLQQARQERLARYDSEISRTYARYLELGEQKKALLDQMLQLTQPAPPARR